MPQAASKPEAGAAKARYEQLKSNRNTALNRARTNSKLTIPGIVPEDGQDAGASFEQPYQSLGARAVNNLSAWLLVTLFPPDQQFFRLSIHEDTAQELGTALSEAENALARISSKAQLLVETHAARPVFMEIMRHLVIAGNALLYYPPDGGSPRMFRLDQYVVLRDERGRLLEAVIHEQVLPAALPPQTLAAAKIGEGEDVSKKLDLYTHVKLDGENIVHHQEINGAVVPGSEGKSPREKSGWMALRWQSVPGSDYGRAHVSEYLGDLLSLEDLNKAIIQFAAVAARVVYLVDPSAMVGPEELAEAETGDFLSGHADRVQALQLDKTTDFSVASQVAERIELRLSHAFMLQSGTVRQAERVTAEEIRAMAEELENVLGGVYTVLSAEFQLPLVHRLLYILERNQEAPPLPKSVLPMIVTGFEAMGRNHSANKLRAWMADMGEIYGPEVVSRITDPTEVGRRLGVSYGIEDLGNLIKSPEALAQEDEQAAMQQGAMAALPTAAKSMVEGMVPSAEEIPTGATE